MTSKKGRATAPPVDTWKKRYPRCGTMYWYEGSDEPIICTKRPNHKGRCRSGPYVITKYGVEKET